MNKKPECYDVIEPAVETTASNPRNHFSSFFFSTQNVNDSEAAKTLVEKRFTNVRYIFFLLLRITYLRNNYPINIIYFNCFNYLVTQYFMLKSIKKIINSFVYSIAYCDVTPLPFSFMMQNPEHRCDHSQKTK